MRILLSLVCLTASSSALPCSLRVPDLLTGTYAFEDRTVPRNAELRFGAVADLPTVPLTLPDGSVVEVPVGADDVSGFLDFEGELAPGDHSINLPARAETGQAGRTISFTVSDEVDDDAPSAPEVSASRHTGGSITGDSCSSEWPTDEVTIIVEGDAPFAFASRDGLPVSATMREGDSNAVIRLVEDDGGTVSYDVVVRDFAGNVSDATSVDVWAGCKGGCASSSSSLPMAATLLLLLARRRRR